MKTASEILFEYGIDIMKMNDDFNSQLLFAMERYAEQFKPTPSSTVDLEREAEELYQPPQTDTGYELYNVWEVIDAERAAYIKGRQTSQKGLYELIEWLKLEAADLMDSNNATDKAASIYIKNCVITKATELLNKP